MNRFNFLVLITIVGYVGFPVEAEPILISQVGDFGSPDPRAVKWHMDQRVGEPTTAPPAKLRGKLLGGASAAKRLQKGTPNTKATDKIIGKMSMPQVKKHDPKTVGDFGKLPTKAYQPKQNVDGAAPPHPSDFSTVPIEQGPDIRKAK